VVDEYVDGAEVRVHGVDQAARGETLSDGTPDAAARARDDRDAVGEGTGRRAGARGEGRRGLVHSVSVFFAGQRRITISWARLATSRPSFVKIEPE
jgi:hypothetical protein